MNKKEAGRAVCLLSGGMDSAVSTAIASNSGYEVYALTIDYGQRHSRELKSAKSLTEHFSASEHKLIKLDLREIGGSALTDDMEVPKGVETRKDIPDTYVPARNTIFLSIALAYAEAIGADAIFIGANALDYSGYPDCRPEYYEAFRVLAGLATRCGVTGSPVSIETPIIGMKKSEIVRKGEELGVPFALTWSCYAGEDKACGRCDSCVLRRKGFKEAGLTDPIEYKK